jgi:hypothetical protein
MRPRCACLLVALALVIACDGASRRSSPESAPELAPLNTQRRDSTQKASEVPAPVSVVRGDCVTSGRVALRGTVRREVRFGAPGYGEDTLKDLRDTIAVLVLPKSLVLCADSAMHRPDDRSPLRFAKVTLWHVPRSILDRVGTKLTVYGRLEEAAYAFEQGPILLRVDSIPALRRSDGVSTS